jgi:hypothetical protein
METLQQEVIEWFKEVRINIGIDKPSNHDEIIDFICDDVYHSASPEYYHSGDFAIAFRRFLEQE